jgi:hypothetical protein
MSTQTYYESDDFWDSLDDFRSQEEIDAEDEYIESRGGIDKCMNCGKYKYNDELSYPDQTCIKGCVNPNEY